MSEFYKKTCIKTSKIGKLTSLIEIQRWRGKRFSLKQPKSTIAIFKFWFHQEINLINLALSYLRISLTLKCVNVEAVVVVVSAFFSSGSSTRRRHDLVKEFRILLHFILCIFSSFRQKG